MINPCIIGVFFFNYFARCLTCTHIKTNITYFYISLFVVFSGLLSPDHGRGVTPVYLRCAAGRVTWLYPRGALRILLRFPAKDREFRACIRIHSSSNPENKYAKKSLFPARLFLEGPRSLLPLYAENDGGNSIRCFQSKNGQAAIYVEANDADDIKRRVADIEYDLELMPRGKGYDPAEGRYLSDFKCYFP